MGFLQWFHFVIKYKKGSTNKLANMLSRPPTTNIIALGTLMHMESFTHYAYREEYIEDEDFKDLFQQLQGKINMEEGDIKVDYHFQNDLLYKLDKLCS
jgi:hypothetical protein